MYPPKEVKITLDLSSHEALALAQFVKRVSWSELRANAVSDDETYDMRGAIGHLQAALADAGYSPR